MTIVEIWQNLVDFITGFFDFLNMFREIFIEIINFFPSPSKEILLFDIPVIIVIILWNLK